MPLYKSCKMALAPGVGYRYSIHNKAINNITVKGYRSLGKIDIKRQIFFP